MNFYHKPCSSVSQWVDVCPSPWFPEWSVCLQAQRGSRGRIHRPSCESLAESTCNVAGGGENILLDHHSVTLQRHLSDKLVTEPVSPVPNFDGVPRGGEDRQVIWAEGQRAHIGAVASEREASRLIGRGGLVWSLQAVGLDGVVLQQQRHLQLTTCTGQALRPSERRWRRGVYEVRK